MLVLRSFLFNLTFYFWTAGVSVFFLPILATPSRSTVWMQRMWAGGVLAFARFLVGIDIEVRGRENLPDGAMIVAAKHQSTWDTVVYPALLVDPAIVMKRELFRIPLYGWYMHKCEMIGVDRSAGSKALRQLLVEGRAAAKRARPIVIFPEGTRSAVDSRLPYQPGVAALYRDLGVPVAPVAVNSGLFWPRRRFLKRPGIIILEFLPAIPPGLDRATFMATLEERIEQATDRLVAEGRSVDKPEDKPGDIRKRLRR